MIPISPPAIVEVNQDRRYVDANPSACALLGYSREELLSMRIDDVSYPSAAHVSPMFARYRGEGGLRGRFAVQTKRGEVLWIRYEAEVDGGRMIARWTEYEPVKPSDLLAKTS
jgi:PAS domain S-box-containing protein